MVQWLINRNRCGVCFNFFHVKSSAFEWTYLNVTCSTYFDMLHMVYSKAARGKFCGTTMGCSRYHNVFHHFISPFLSFLESRRLCAYETKTAVTFKEFLLHLSTPIIFFPSAAWTACDIGAARGKARRRSDWSASSCRRLANGWWRRWGMLWEITRVFVRNFWKATPPWRPFEGLELWHDFLLGGFLAYSPKLQYISRCTRYMFPWPGGVLCYLTPLFLETDIGIPVSKWPFWSSSLEVAPDLFSKGSLQYCEKKHTLNFHGNLRYPPHSYAPKK